MKKCLITGVSGQDGSYLSELLLTKGYKVHGLVRPKTDTKRENISHISGLYLIEGELSDPNSVYSIIEAGQYDEIYNLAAQSHVGTSFKQPDYTFKVNALGVQYMLEAINKYSRHSRFYQASTSELFGSNFDVDGEDMHRQGVVRYQDENTDFAPRSPYAISKMAAHNTVRMYREGYGIHASSGILFNHESERRGANFVTRKITKWVGAFTNANKNAKNQLGLDYEGARYFDEDNIGFDHHWEQTFPKLRLGNIEAARDWGHAEDYVRAMYLMLQQEKPDDYVIATGQAHTIKDFLREAFNEIGIDDYTQYIVIDPEFYRPAEVDYLCGRADKARQVLGWKPDINFKQLVVRMIERDLNEEKTQEAEEKAI